LIVAAIVLYPAFCTNFIAYNILCAVIGSSSIVVATLLSFRHLRSL
jgi:hypothetical protein